MCHRVKFVLKILWQPLRYLSKIENLGYDILLKIPGKQGESDEYHVKI